MFFSQQHVPGRLGQSDFTYMNELAITIGGQSFPHMLYHFVLTYSNWEDATLCYSESFESLGKSCHPRESRATPEHPRLIFSQFNQNSLLPKLCGEPRPRRISTAWQIDSFD